MNQEQPGMEKNLILAFALSMIILFGYSFLMQKLYPTPATPPTQEGELAPDAEAEAQVLRSQEKTIEAAQAMLEKAVAPTIVPFENDVYRAEFSTLGGTLISLDYKGSNEFSDVSTTFFRGEPKRSGLFALKQSREEANLGETIFKANRKGHDIEFVYEKPEEYRLIKTFHMRPSEPVIELGITLENLSQRTRHYPFEFGFGMSPDEKYRGMYTKDEVIVKMDKIKTADHNKLMKKPKLFEKEVEWSGILQRYFTMLVKPSWKAVANEAKADKITLYNTLMMEPLTLGPREVAREGFLVYAGPIQYSQLKAQDAGFENVLTRGMLGQIKVLLLGTLNWIYKYVNNYGWAIIILTFIIKLLFAPLTHIGFESSRKMQAIQPKLKSIQERHKNNPEKSQKETMELFRRNKVNPLAGCLPMLIQLPIFFAMFRILPESIELNGAPFIFWMDDLSQPDRLFLLPFTIPLLGWDAFNLLPILMTVSQVFYQKVMPQASISKEQAAMFKFMPIFIGVICYNMPSGLVLYWTAQNLMSVAHQFNANKIKVVLHQDDQD